MQRLKIVLTFLFVIGTSFDVAYQVRAIPHFARPQGPTCGVAILVAASPCARFALFANGEANAQRYVILRAYMIAMLRAVAVAVAIALQLLVTFSIGATAYRAARGGIVARG